MPWSTHNRQTDQADHISGKPRHNPCHRLRWLCATAFGAAVILASVRNRSMQTFR
jgi:hypothetical protein